MILLVLLLLLLGVSPASAQLSVPGMPSGTQWVIIINSEGQEIITTAVTQSGPWTISGVASSTPPILQQQEKAPLSLTTDSRVRTEARLPHTSVQAAIATRCVNLAGDAFESCAGSGGTTTVEQATAANLNAQVQGPAASGAAKSGNPVQTGAVYNVPQPTVTTGQAVEAQATARGALIVAPGVDGFPVSGTVAAQQSGPWTMGGTASTNPPIYADKAPAVISLTTDGRARVEARMVPGAVVSTTTADPCSGRKTPAPFSISTATTTQLVAAELGKTVYICSLNLVTTAANNIAIVEDDTSACASPTAGMAGGTTAAAGWNFGANGGLTLGNGAGSILQTAATNRFVCIMTSAATQLSGSIQYVIAP